MPPSIAYLTPKEDFCILIAQIMHYLTRLVEFEASHRYWNPVFSEEENYRTFGKCISPYGHGHNYVLQVTLGGRLDGRETPRSLDLAPPLARETV
jgi:hypothetical protein